MKKIFAASVTCLVVALLFWNWKGLSLVARADKTENDLLKQTVLLSQQVKQFEKTLGIKPGLALQKSIEEQPASSTLLIVLQKKCTLALHEPFDAEIRTVLALPEEKVPIKEFEITAEGMTSYLRLFNVFSEPRSVITPGFAAKAVRLKVVDIIHEDLHEIFRFPLNYEEALVTPLSYLATREFFKSIGDRKNAKESDKKIAELRAMTQEMDAFTKYLKTVFKESPCDDSRKKAYRRMEFIRRYKKMYLEDAAGQTDILEAKVSYDFYYWKYFNAIISLHELGVPLKTLIADLKKSPATHPEITQYFTKLEERYRKQYNR